MNATEASESPASSLRPEQQAALDYARARGTEAPVGSIAERLARTFGELDALLAEVPPEVAARKPAGGWSVHEVADHLVVSHRLAVGQLLELLAGRAPAGGPIPAGLQSEAPDAIPWRELAGELSRVHATFLQAVQAAPDETPLESRAPVVMVVPCARPDGTHEPVHWVQHFDWKAFAILFRMHAHQHLGQARRVLAEVGAGASA